MAVRDNNASRPSKLAQSVGYSQVPGTLSAPPQNTKTDRLQTSRQRSVMLLAPLSSSIHAYRLSFIAPVTNPQFMKLLYYITDTLKSQTLGDRDLTEMRISPPQRGNYSEKCSLYVGSRYRSNRASKLLTTLCSLLVWLQPV